LFQQTNPDVRVQLHDSSGTETIAALHSGALDVALTVQGLSKTMAGLTFEELRQYAVCVAVPAKHPLAAARKVSLKQLVNEPLIAYSRADYHDYHVMIEPLFARLKRQPEIAEEHDGATSLIASVGAGRGFAFVTETFTSFAGSQVKILPLVPAPPPLAVGVAYLKKKAVLAGTRDFVLAAKRAALMRS
jgi:DNA-binding transcriptional LysR family regulator